MHIKNLEKRKRLYINSIRDGKTDLLTKRFLKELKEILLRYDKKPLKKTKHQGDDYLFVLFFLTEFDHYMTNVQGIDNRKNRKFPDNGIFLSYFRNAEFIDDLLLALLNFLNVNEPFYYYKEELLNAINEYEKGLLPKLFNKSPTYKKTSKNGM